MDGILCCRASIYLHQPYEANEGTKRLWLITRSRLYAKVCACCDGVKCQGKSAIRS